MYAEFWFQKNGSSFLISDCLGIKKLLNLIFLTEFSFSSISSLNISAVYVKVPYQVVPYKKEACIPLFRNYSKYILKLTNHANASRHGKVLNG